MIKIPVNDYVIIKDRTKKPNVQNTDIIYDKTYQGFNYTQWYIWYILSNNNVVFIFWSYDMFGELGFTEYIPSPTRCESLPRWDCSKKWDCGLRFFEFRYCYNNDINLIYINLIHIGLLLLFVVFSGLILFFSVFFFWGGGQTSRFRFKIVMEKKGFISELSASIYIPFLEMRMLELTHEKIGS